MRLLDEDVTVRLGDLLTVPMMIEESGGRLRPTALYYAMKTGAMPCIFIGQVMVTTRAAFEEYLARRRQVEGGGEPPEHLRPGLLHDAALDLRDERLLHVGALGELVLGVPPLLAPRAELLAEWWRRRHHRGCLSLCAAIDTIRPRARECHRGNLPAGTGDARGRAATPCMYAR